MHFDSACKGYNAVKVRKPDFCICENKDADQLRGNREADQRLCFRYIDNTIPLNPQFQVLAIFYDCTARFVWNQVKNPENRFSHNDAQMLMGFFRSIVNIHKEEDGSYGTILDTESVSLTLR